MAEQFIRAKEIGPCAACGHPSLYIGINAGGHLHVLCEGWYDTIIDRDMTRMELDEVKAQRDALVELYVQTTLAPGHDQWMGSPEATAAEDRCIELGLRGPLQLRLWEVEP
jgi:hypothetical protein